MSTAAATAPAQSLRPLTPKEFAAALGGLRSADWVRAECAAYIRDRKRRRKEPRGIRTVNGSVPYLIDPAELARFRPSLEELRFLVTR